MEFKETEQGNHRAEGTLEEWHALKRAVFPNREYVERISVGLMAHVVDLHAEYKETECVLRELDYLEGLSMTSRTRPESQFKHSPLHPLWHKHYTTPRDIVPNIYSHWGVLEIAQKRQSPIPRVRSSTNWLQTSRASVAMILIPGPACSSIG